MTTIQDGLLWESAFSKQRLLGQGYLYALDSAIFGLASSASRTLQLVNNAEKPVLLLQLNVIILSDKGDHTISLFSGGSISGGVAIPQVPQKNFGIQPSPYASALDDVTIDVAGDFLGAFSQSFTRIGGFIFTSAGSSQYITVTNAAAQASTGIQVQALAARIE